MKDKKDKLNWQFEKNAPGTYDMFAHLLITSLFIYK